MEEIRNPVPPPGTPLIEDHEQVARYLSDAAAVLGAPSPVYDKLDDSSPVIGSVVWITDGEFVWPGELEHYVRTYHTSPPEGLLRRIRKLNYTCPTVSPDKVSEALSMLSGTRPMPDGFADSRNTDPR